jgi:hypothetical protein
MKTKLGLIIVGIGLALWGLSRAADTGLKNPSLIAGFTLPASGGGGETVYALVSDYRSRWCTTNITGISDGERVPTLTDMGPVGMDLSQSVTAQQAWFSNSVQNGKPGLYSNYDGGGVNYQTYTNRTSLARLTNFVNIDKSTIFLVAKLSPAAHNIFHFEGASGYSIAMNLRNDPSTNITTFCPFFWQQTLNSDNIAPFNATHIFEYFQDDTNVNLRLDGVSVGTLNSRTDNCINEGGRFHLFNRWDDNPYLGSKGFFFDLIIYNRALTDNERFTNRVCLTNLYGL